MKAAAASGADAVYFGVDAFNARQRAENFRLQDLPEVMQWLHQRGVKGFLTFNVLVFSDELEAAAQLLIAADRAGVDAVIVQDVGLCRLAQRLVPNLCVHGSTQMSITSAACWPVSWPCVISSDCRHNWFSGTLRCRWRCLCMAPFASPIPVNV